MRADDQSVSALMPVHAGVSPEHLELAVMSVLGQSVPVDEFVVVEDGPLLPAQTAVLDAAGAKHPALVRVRLPVNSGAGVANQAGLVAAHGDWIMKTDADDINALHRVDTQLRACRSRGLDVCGSAMLEFTDDPDQPHGLRRPPESLAGIRRRARWNNPMNHPTTFFRRDLALAVGGYPSLRYMQDYDLFVRMLMSGAVMANLAEPLVSFRADSRMRNRRRGTHILRLDWQLQRRLRRHGLIGWGRVARNMTLRTAVRLVPDAATRVIYERVLSRPLAPVPVVVKEDR